MLVIFILSLIATILQGLGLALKLTFFVSWMRDGKDSADYALGKYSFYSFLPTAFFEAVFIITMAVSAALL